jgi:hypothetical protein
MGNNLYESVGYGKQSHRSIERQFVVAQNGTAADGPLTMAQARALHSVLVFLV